MPTTRADSAITSFVRTFGGLTLLTVGFIATIGTILGFFGSAWWLFDVLSGYRVQFAVALVVAGVLYGLILGQATSLVFLVAAIVNVIVILPLYLDDPAPATNAESVDVASVNVRTGATGREDVFRWVDTSNADLVFLFETSDAWVEEIENAALGYQVMAEIPSDRVYGITVLARNSMTVETLRVGSTKDQVVRTETTVADMPVVVYALQPRTPSSEIEANARDEVIDFVARRAQEETSPVMVVGALNATPWSHAFRNLSATADLVDSGRGFGFQPSWPAGRWTGLTIPTNHLLHSPELTTLERLVGPDLGSDHKPLLVRVAPSAA